MDVSVGTRLRVLRKDAGLTQAQLAALAGTNQAAINRYETDRAAAPYRVLVWYANYFNVSLDYIFGLCEDPRGRYVCVTPEGGAGGGAAQTGLERVCGSLLHAGQ
ncbi:MAG: helix-turn-helix domain-containing protein [Subdoligranulum sp.]